MKLFILFFTLVMGVSLSGLAQETSDPKEIPPNKTRGNADDCKSRQCSKPTSSKILSDTEVTMLCNGRGKDISGVDQDAIAELIARNCSPKPGAGKSGHKSEEDAGK